MSPLLTLGLLVAGFCPAVLGHPGGTLGSETLVQEDGDNVTRVDRVSLASRNSDFAFSLYKQLALKNPKKNIIFSPFSVSVSLAFLSLGAHNTTQKEILESLKFNITEISEAEIHRSFEHLLHTISQPGDQLQLSTGSAMFVQEQLQLLAKFKEDAQALYKAQAFTTDFLQPAKAQKLINDYVRRQTQGKIDELISGLDPRTAMVLVNYIFFKSKWKKPFDPRDTFESKFYLSKSRSVKVPMMKIEDLTVPYFWDEELSCSVVELEYLGNASALFILPDHSQMQKLETSLSLETLRRWKDSMKLSMIDELYLPKFSISSDYNLEHVLPTLGIREVFSKQADLSRITGARNLRVSQVVHKAILDVTEVGTEAAAATGIKMVPLSGKWDPMILSYNRPFILIVKEGDTESILFLGRVVNPKQA